MQLEAHSLGCQEHTSLYVASDGNMITYLTINDLGTYLGSCPHLNWGGKHIHHIPPEAILCVVKKHKLFYVASDLNMIV